MGGTYRGYDSQQDDRPVEPGRPDNIDAPVPFDPGAHGEFDARAKSSSAQLWLRMHRPQLAIAAGAAGIAWLAFRHAR